MPRTGICTRRAASVSRARTTLEFVEQFRVRCHPVLLLLGFSASDLAAALNINNIRGSFRVRSNPTRIIIIIIIRNYGRQLIRHLSARRFAEVNESRGGEEGRAREGRGRRKSSREEESTVLGFREDVRTRESRMPRPRSRAPGNCDCAEGRRSRSFAPSMAGPCISSISISGQRILCRPGRLGRPPPSIRYHRQPVLSIRGMRIEALAARRKRCARARARCRFLLLLLLLLILRYVSKHAAFTLLVRLARINRDYQTNSSAPESALLRVAGTWRFTNNLDGRYVISVMAIRNSACRCRRAFGRAKRKYNRDGYA